VTVDVTESFSLLIEMIFRILTLLSVWTREGSDYDSVNKVRRGTEETLQRLRGLRQITQYTVRASIREATAFKTLFTFIAPLHYRGRRPFKMSHAYC